MAKFFIDRPIFAWVIALFVIVIGAVSITKLPISQYPPVAPPAIVLTAVYPGASARALEESVISVIERVSDVVRQLHGAVRRRERVPLVATAVDR